MIAILAAAVLFGKHLKFDAAHPDWPDRDRFVLSNGHASMLLYSVLHLTGYEDMTIEQIRIHPGSATKDEAMREAAQILQDAGAVTAAYYDAMLQREEAVSTYMGNELAIPHGTNETKDAILDSALSFVRYDGGIDWDGQDVTFVVGIAGKGDEHLEILSQIALIFSEDDDVARLKAAATPEELLALLSSVNG